MFWGWTFRHIIAPVAAAYTAKHCKNVAVISSKITQYKLLFFALQIIVPLVLYHLTWSWLGLYFNAEVVIYWEKEPLLRNYQSYFSILLVYGVKQGWHPNPDDLLTLVQTWVSTLQIA